MEAEMGGDTAEWRAIYALQKRRSDFRNSPAGQQLLSDFERKHESIKQEYQRIIDLSCQLLTVEAKLLNELDHELARRLGVDPPEPINKVGFYGRRCANRRLEIREDMNRRTANFRDPEDGRVRFRVFDTKAEALDFEKQIAEEWVKIIKRKKAEKSRKRHARLKRWVYERLQVSVRTSAGLRANRALP